jgi:excisionase family DNA binding protein
MDKTLTVAEAAERRGVKPATIRLMIANGMPAEKVPTGERFTYRIRAAVLDTFPLPKRGRPPKVHTAGG